MSDRKTYTAEDIRLYLEGKLSPAEMHSIEKASLEDSFLADAIEGMQQYANNETFFVGSAQLKESLSARVKKKRRTVVMSLPMLAKIAAILMIVVTGVAIIIYTGKENEKESVEIVKKEEQQVRRTDAPHEDSKKPNDDSTRRSLFSDTDVAAYKKEKASAPLENQQARKINPAPPVPEIVKAEEFESASPQNLDSSPPIDSKANSTAAQPLEGRVAGVDVSANRNQRKETDTTLLENSKAELNEVVVTAYGISKARNKLYNSPSANNRTERRIVPDGGWLQFENYLDQNKNTTTYDTTLTGTEKLSFIIDTTGRPSLITIINSISPQHDKELIRLIDAGPAWEVKTGNKRKVTLSVIF